MPNVAGLAFLVHRRVGLRGVETLQLATDARGAQLRARLGFDDLTAEQRAEL